MKYSILKLPKEQTKPHCDIMAKKGGLTMDEHWIFHCDCNSFYASVELLSHPELKSEPVAVCGDPQGRHGIILAKNDAAKKFGITTAETVWQAKKKCPQLVLLPPHHKRYRQFSNRINAIYQEYTDLVQPFGIDESWLDVTHTWQRFAPNPVDLAHQIRRRIHKETGLTISVGVSFNKVFAKLGSDYKKPDAVTLFDQLNYRQLVWPQPVGNLLYVGRSAQQVLLGLGIRTIGDLAAAQPRILTDALGKLGAQLSRYARGLDDDPVRPAGQQEPVKSVGNGCTFRRDLVTESEVKAGLWAMADEVAGRLRHQGLWAGAVQVTIRGSDLHNITRQKQLGLSTHLAKTLAQECWGLVKANWPIGKPIRMLTVTALSLTEEPFAVQQSLFCDAPKPDPRRESLEKSMDAIRSRYGQTSIGAGSALRTELGLSGLAMEKQSSDQED